MGCFAVNLDINTSLHAERFYVVHAIEIAYTRCWHMLWIWIWSSNCFLLLL